MQDLLQTMNLSKSSLYQTYGNKHSLFQQCLTHYNRMITRHLSDGLTCSRHGLSFIKDTFEMLLNNIDPPDKRIGCLIMNTAAEFAQRDPEIATLTRKATESFTEVFKQAIENAQQAGEIDGSKDSSQLAAYVMANVAGLNMMIKAGLPKTTLQKIVDQVLASLN